MAFAYAKAGVYGLGAIKLAIALLVAYWMLVGTLPNWGMAIVIAIYGLVVLHLLREMRKLEVKNLVGKGE